MKTGPRIECPLRFAVLGGFAAVALSTSVTAQIYVDGEPTVQIVHASSDRQLANGATKSANGVDPVETVEAARVTPHRSYSQAALGYTDPTRARIVTRASVMPSSQTSGGAWEINRWSQRRYRADDWGRARGYGYRSYDGWGYWGWGWPYVIHSHVGHHHHPGFHHHTPRFTIRHCDPWTTSYGFHGSLHSGGVRIRW